MGTKMTERVEPMAPATIELALLEGEALSMESLVLTVAGGVDVRYQSKVLS